MDAWSGCVSGAEDTGDYVTWLKAAGFSNISIREKGNEAVELANAAPSSGRARPFSARITAEKS
jgi:hypothetical protein